MLAPLGTPGRAEALPRPTQRWLMVAGIRPDAPSALTSTAVTPPSAQAQPQTSTASPAAKDRFGAGDTMTDSGAIDQTGQVGAIDCPDASRTTSLYQRVVND